VGEEDEDEETEAIEAAVDDSEEDEDEGAIIVATCCTVTTPPFFLTDILGGRGGDFKIDGTPSSTSSLISASASGLGCLFSRLDEERRSGGEMKSTSSWNRVIAVVAWVLILSFFSSSGDCFDACSATGGAALRMPFSGAGEEIVERVEGEKMDGRERETGCCCCCCCCCGWSTR